MNFFPAGNAPAQFRAQYFVGDNGRRVLLAWNDSPRFVRELTVTLPSGARNIRFWNVDDGTYRVFNATSTHRLYPVDMSRPTMIFATWDE